MEGQSLVTEYTTVLPDARLRRLVDFYTGYREAPATPLLRREFAGSRLVLILGWGDAITVTDPRGGAAWTGESLLAGPHDSFVVTKSSGVAEAVQLLLSPWGARVVFGAPLGELANRTIATGDLTQRWLDELTQRLAEASSWADRFAILDAALLARLNGAHALDPRLGAPHGQSWPIASQ